MIGARAVLLVVVLVIGSCGVFAAAAGAAPGDRVYVALGDSVTQSGSSSGQRYPERFFDFLQQAGAANTLQNVGVSGATSSSILESQLTNALSIIDDPSTDTTVVTVDIGGNDVLGFCDPEFGTGSFAACLPTLDAFSANFATLLNAINGALANDPGTEQLIVMAYYNPWSGRAGQEAVAANAALVLLGPDGQIDCTSAEATQGLNDRIACVGAEHGAKLADAYPSFLSKGTIDPLGTLNPPGWFADRIHPNDLGHAAIADVFAAAFSEGEDLTAPTITAPATIRVIATSSGGAPVSYNVTASDNQDADPSVTCTPPSGATFPIGTTTVACTANDAAGNSATASFQIIVAPPPRPTAKAQCRNGGWRTFPVFKNQGDCVSFVATKGKNPPARQ